MKKLAILLAIALELAVSGCGNSTTTATDTVTGPFTLTIKSNSNSNALALTGTVTGTSSGTTTTIGNLSNGVVVGTWTLNSSDSNCTGGGSTPPSGTFVMCQGAATCSVTSAAAEPVEKL